MYKKLIFKELSNHYSYYCQNQGIQYMVIMVALYCKIRNRVNLEIQQTGIIEK